MTLPDVIRQLAKKYIKYGDAKTPQGINSGLCESFAADIEDLMPGIDILAVEEVMVGYDGDPSGNDKFDWALLKKHWGSEPPEGLSSKDIDRMTIGGHFWIHHQGRHYDAECPDGVKSFFELPYFERQISCQLDEYGPTRSDKTADHHQHKSIDLSPDMK